MPSALVIGNSDGIGLALTKVLLAEGWLVRGVSRSVSSIDDPAYEHELMDVNDERYPARVSSIVSKLGGVDVCVYSAGIGETVDVETLASDRRVFETNLLATVAVLFFFVRFGALIQRWFADQKRKPAVR